MKLANNLLGLLNILSFLISIPVLFVGIQLYRVDGSGTQCFELLRYPVLILGVLIMVMSIIGIIGACCRVSWLLWIYLFAMLLLLIALMCVYAVSIVGLWKTNEGTRVRGTEVKEYKLSAYTDWLQNTVQRKGWDKVKHCLIISDGCSDMPKDDTTLQEFNMQELHPILSGCCKPPLADCGFSYHSPTVWKKTNSSSSNPDCKAWDNDPKVKCFNCDSCKAGVLQQLIVSWKRMYLLKFALLGFLMLVYSIGCCAFRNTRKQPEYWRRQN